jgi:hypothetical protein
MKNALFCVGMLIIAAGRIFAQDDPAKIKAKIAAAAVVKVKADVIAKVEKERALLKVNQIDAIKVRVLKAALDKVQSQVLVLSRNAQFGLLGSNVKNAPYAAEAITETHQVLEDGTRIDSHHSYKIYRDSQGRMRRESESGAEVWIVDPVANISYVLDTGKQEARTVSLWLSRADSGAREFVGQAGTGPARILVPNKIKNEPLAGAPMTNSLGKRTVEGVEAEGKETINTIAAGSIGNDRPIVIKSESWYSPELQLEVMTRHYDPRTGESTFRLSGLRRDEPAPDLFKVPSNYKILSGK